jgi:hypothetical protein
MSIFGSWVVTVAFCFIVFPVGKHSKLKGVGTA